MQDRPLGPLWQHYPSKCPDDSVRVKCSVCGWWEFDYRPPPVCPKCGNRGNGNENGDSINDTALHADE